MTDRSDRASRTLSEIPDAEREAFYETANRFLKTANDLIGSEPTEEIAAAFLYACARFNCFAMQSMADDPSAIDDETVDYLAAEFERHMRDHMAEDLGAAGNRPEHRDRTPGRVVQILDRLDARDQDDLSDFLDLADNFINVANGLTQAERTGRISATFMHACTRFNVFTMQGQGHPEGEIDEALIGRFRQAYVDLVTYHLRETLIAPRA